MAEPIWHEFLEPDWFWDGVSESARRFHGGGVGVYVRGREYGGMRVPTTGVSFSASHRRMRGRLVTPGWVNFHSHLELSMVPRPEYGGSFVGWLGNVMRAGPASGEEAADAAVRGARASLRYGVTEVVDITRNPYAVRKALAGVPIRVRSCGEVTGLAKRVFNGAAMWTAALSDSGLEGSMVEVGMSPHAPYSTDAMWYARCASDAAENQRTLTTHLCETPEEREFLRSHSGPFREMWERLGDWEQGVETFEGGPVRWLEENGVLRGTNLIAAHVNDVTDEELAILGANDVTVVHCPRTHAYFERPRFELERYLRAGVWVKLGTDSVASSGDLDLMEDVRLFARQNPGLGAAEVMGMVVDQPLTEGAGADFNVWEVRTEDPLREILESEGLRPSEVWVAGVRVVGSGV